MEAASLGKHVLWVRYWVISSSEESGEKREAGGRRGTPPPHEHRCIYKYYIYNNIVPCNFIHKYTQHSWVWGGCSYSGSPASFIVTARQGYRLALMPSALWIQPYQLINNTKLDPAASVVCVGLCME